MACLLGIEDEALSQADLADYTVNKVGGKPNWASGTVYPNPQCIECGRSMLLALQIYAPLDGSPYHRTLYHFCCLDIKCHSKPGGWACLRDQILDNKSSSPTPTKVSTVSAAAPSAWVEDADDWGDEEEDMNPLPSMESLKIAEEKPKKEVESAVPDSMIIAQPSAEVEGMEESVTLDEAPQKPSEDIRRFFTPSEAPVPETGEFSSFYIHVMEDSPITSTDSKLDQRAKDLWLEYQRRENCDWNVKKPSKSGGDKESYEKAGPSHGDELVHKFISRVQQCPEQLIRYNLGASPLLLKSLTNKESLSQQKCRYCGSDLVFEIQLMPHLSQRLVLADFELNQTPVEIGTVVVFTCSQSCWSTSDKSYPKREHIVIQSEMF